MKKFILASLGAGVVAGAAFLVIDGILNSAQAQYSTSTPSTATSTPGLATSTPTSTPGTVTSTPGTTSTPTIPTTTLPIVTTTPILPPLSTSTIVSVTDASAALAQVQTQVQMLVPIIVQQQSTTQNVVGQLATMATGLQTLQTLIAAGSPSSLATVSSTLALYQQQYSVLATMLATALQQRAQAFQALQSFVVRLQAVNGYLMTVR